MRRIVCVVLVCVGWLLSSVAQATSVSLDDKIMFLGQSTESILRIGGLGGPGVSPHLGAFDLDISFDPTIIYLASVTFQDGRFNSGLGEPDILSFTRSTGTTLVPHQLGAGDSLASATLSATVLGQQVNHLIEVSLLPVNDPVLTQQETGFILAVLRFGGLNIGSSDLTITINGLSDEWGNSLPASHDDGRVSVIAFPIPEIDAASGTIAIGLLLGALALLGERRRRPQSEVAG